MEIFTPECTLKNIPHSSYHAFQLSLTENSRFRKKNMMESLFLPDSSKYIDCMRQRYTTSNPKRHLQITNDPFEVDLFKLKQD